MFIECPLKKGECAYCGMFEGELYCGIAKGENKISKMTKCPLEGKRTKEGLFDAKGKKENRSQGHKKAKSETETEDTQIIF